MFGQSPSYHVVLFPNGALPTPDDIDDVLAIQTTWYVSEWQDMRYTPWYVSSTICEFNDMWAHELSDMWAPRYVRSATRELRDMWAPWLLGLNWRPRRHPGQETGAASYSAPYFRYHHQHKVILSLSSPVSPAQIHWHRKHHTWPHTYVSITSTNSLASKAS